MNVATSNTTLDSSERMHNDVPAGDSSYENASAFNVDVPPSLYDSQNNYSSIFDNMPEERNDLYTVLSNTFSFTSEKSTQVSNYDLQSSPETQNTQQNTFTNDFLVIETPGAPMDANQINENAFLASGGGDGELLRDELTATVTNTMNTSSVGEMDSVDLGAETILASDINTNVATSIDNVVIEPIPEPPSAPDLAAEAASQLNALGESTFASLGLGGWTPVGIVQNCFEFLHVSLGIPWWEAIAIGNVKKLNFSNTYIVCWLQEHW